MSPPKFAEGERVLCFHGPLLYEAKCLKVRSNSKDNTQTEYWVHYAGWKKSWDEWVPETRILKYTEQSLQQQKAMQKPLKGKNVKKKGLLPKVAKTPGKETKASDVKSEGSVNDSDSRSSTPVLDAKKKKEVRRDSVKRESPVPESAEPKKKKAKHDSTVESESAFTQRIEIRVKLPEDLKPWIVDDWDLIIRQKKLVNLPADKTVEQILDDYISFKKTCKNTTLNRENACKEVVRGLKEYFNTMIGSQLLFKFERPQYADMLAQFPDKPMAQVYGVHHLLRLFVKIGTVLAYTALNEKSIGLLLATLQDVLKYLTTNSATLFSVQNYGIAPPEYQRKTM